MSKSGKLMKRKPTSSKESQARNQITSNFIEGSIVRIKLENLLTYDSVEFNCGPFLNVIIGPNGTGKSTVVCAICLGLAGKISWLGRATQQAEYIKYGCTKASIEIELYNPDGDNYIVCREINKSNTSTWSVNDRPATQKHVEEMVSRLNIQVGNLCQFLPQEKVADFAKMTPQELLENTEKAVAATEMFDTHQWLKSARSDSRKLELSFNNHKSHLEQEQQKNSRIEQDVKNYEERQRRLKRVELLLKKRPWMEYEEKREEFLQVKRHRDKAGEELRSAQESYAPLKTRLNNAHVRVKAIDTEMKKKTENVKEHANQAHERSKRIEAESDKLTEVHHELNCKQNEEDSRQTALHGLRQQLQALEQELASLDEHENVQPAVDRVNHEIHEVNQELNRTHQQGQATQMEVTTLRQQKQALHRELKQALDVGNRRLESLRMRHRHTHDAVHWLRANQHRFKATVHEPMFLCMNVKQPRYAKYVESHVPFKDIQAFVCEDPDDVELFLKVMREEQKLKVNAVRAPDKPVNTFKPPKPITAISRYGFANYLRELIDCPDAVMRYLCSQYRIYMVPVGNKKTKEIVETVIKDNPEMNFFYTENHQYSLKKSKYDGEISAKTSELRDAQILTTSVDTQRTTRLQNDITEIEASLEGKEHDYQELQHKTQALNSRLEQLRREKKDLMKKKEMKRTLISQIEMRKQSIQRKEREAIDMEAETAIANRKIQQINLKKCQLLNDLKHQTMKCFEVSKEKLRLSLQHAMAIKEHIHLEAQLRDQSQSLQALERRFEEIKENLRQTKDQAKRLLLVARKHIGMTGNSDEIPADMREHFAELPSTLAQIDADINEQRARADCNFETDEKYCLAKLHPHFVRVGIDRFLHSLNPNLQNTIQVVEEYRIRQKDIAKTAGELQKAQVDLENHQSEIEEKKAQWIEPLQNLIEKINSNFGYFFKCMKCAGEVDLSIPDNPEDYEKYGVRIKVKYRDAEQLRELSPFHQSGGERSVATVLYMMALQELAKCPFRCVDEINQGMDPINERKVFELVVRTVCKRSGSQYFLLTPKLLPDLEYDNNMVVLLVHNGPTCLHHGDWKLEKFRKRRARIA